MALSPRVLLLAAVAGLLGCAPSSPGEPAVQQQQSSASASVDHRTPNSDMPPSTSPTATPTPADATASNTGGSSPASQRVGVAERVTITVIDP